MASWQDYFTPPGFMGMMPRPPMMGAAPDFSNWAYMPGAVEPPPIATSGEPETGAMPPGWSSRTLIPGAQQLMGAIPGVGPMTRSFDSTFAERNGASPPMMGRQPAPAAMPMPGTLPEGTNPPGAMGMGDLAFPGAMGATTPSVSRETTRKPFDWSENASLWPMLMQAGQGLMQPSHYGFAGQLQQGLAGASEAAQREPDRRLKRAQAEEVDYKREQRKATLEFADTIKDSAARNYMKMGLTAKALERLEKIDPQEQQRVIDFEVAKQNALMPGKIAVARAGKTDVKVTLPGAETEFAKKRSGVQGDIYKGAIEGARAAETILDNVRMAREVLPQVKTGAGTETVAGLKNIAERLGVPTNADAYQTLIAATKKMAFDTLQQFKGPTTERELLFAILASPNTQMTQEALKRALDAVERSQTYKRRYAAEMEKYAGQHGTLNAPGQPSFEEYWQRLVDSEKQTTRSANEPKPRLRWEGPGKWR